MSRVKGAWLYISGILVCMIAVVLPYRLRLFFAKILNYITNPPSWTASLLFQKQLRWWNKVILGMVFFLGLPIAALMMRLGRKTAMDPSGNSWWVARRTPQEIEKGIRDPF